MKPFYSNSTGMSSKVSSKPQSFSASLSAKDESGIYVVLVAVMLLALISVYGLVVDGAKLSLWRLWAQRAADAAAVSGAAMIARDPEIVEDLGVEEFTRRVARVALHNVALRNQLTLDDSDRTNYTLITNGVEAELDGVVVTASVINTTVTTTVRFQSRFILMQLITRSIGLDVEAVASAEVGQALVAIVLDTSQSMSLNDGFTAGSKLDRLKTAVHEFIDGFDQRRDRLALINFASNARVVRGFETTGAGFNKTALHNAVDSLTPGGATNVTAALDEVYKEFLSVRSAAPGFYNQALAFVVVFSDGAPTATRVRFANRLSGSGEMLDEDYVAFGASELDVMTSPLLPFRPIRGTGHTALPYDAADDQVGEAPACSSRNNGFYHPAHSFGACLQDLGFILPEPAVSEPRFEELSIDQYEELFHLSAISYADMLRNYPLKTASAGPRRERNTVFFTIGFGPHPPATCFEKGNPYDNGDDPHTKNDGGGCADYRKDHFLSRIAYDGVFMRHGDDAYPDTGIPRRPEWTHLGKHYVAPGGANDLEQTFEQTRSLIRLRLVQ